MTTEEVQIALEMAFGYAPRPVTFIRGTCNCCECMEYNKILATYTPETIGFEQLGNPAWDPICTASDAAFAYYMPAMVRLAFDSKGYLDHLLFHLTTPGRLDAFNKEQAQALIDALWMLSEVKSEEIEGSLGIYQIEEAFQKLELAI